jgi:hypothetical protein
MYRRIPRYCCGLLLLALFTTLILMREQEVQAQTKKLPAPDKEALAKADTLIRKLYEKELAQAKANSTFGRKLAGDLLKEGLETNPAEDPNLRFAAIALARDVAAGAGDHTTALTAIDELANTFNIDTSAMKSATIAAAVKGADSKEANTELAEMALQMIEEALEHDNYESALSLAETAKLAAAGAKSLALASRVKKVDADVRAMQKEFDRVKTFVTKLQKNPDDKEANLEVGKYYALLKGNWQKGLPLLAKSDDADLKSLAEKDQAKPKASKKQLELAAAWDALGEKEKGPARGQLLRRAYYWYEQALPDLSGLSLVKIEKRMEAIAKEFSPTTSGTGNITGELRRLEGHAGGLSGVSLSADGRWALTGSSGDNTLKLWDAKSGKESRSMTGHTGQIQGVAISPDGKIAASCATDNSIRIWALPGGQLTRTILGHNDWVRGVVFLPGGKQLVSISDDRTVRIWDVGTGKQVRNMMGHTNYINSLSINREGTRALTTSSDNTARIWDLKTGQEVVKFTGHTAIVWAGALSPDATRAVTSSYDNTIRVWDAKNGKELRKLDHKGTMIWAAAFAPGGRKVVTAGGGKVGVNGQVLPNTDFSLHVWDIDNGKEVRKLDGHHTWVRALAFSADGNTLISGSLDATARLWGSK